MGGNYVLTVSCVALLVVLTGQQSSSSTTSATTASKEGTGGTTTTSSGTTTAPYRICICDSTAIKDPDPDATCFITTDELGGDELHHCSCAANKAAANAQLVNGVWVISCGKPADDYSSITTTTSTTTVPTTTEAACEDKNQNDICDKEETAMEMRCSHSILKSPWNNVGKYLLIAAFVYILIWVLATIFINIKHKNKGAHRNLHLFEEIFIVFLFLSMACLNFFFVNKGACKIIAILSHFFMTVVAGAFLFEGVFANSMINNYAGKNGSLPQVANYIVPIIFGLISALVPYFMKKDYYGNSGLHCFASVNSDVFWAFIIPAWILIMIAGYKAQMAFLQCRKWSDEADEEQIYWSFRSCRALLPLSWLIYAIYLTIMFGGDQQKFFILLAAFFMTLILGPAIFFVHTYCHKNSSRAFHPSFFGIYTPCPEVPKKEKPPPRGASPTSSGDEPKGPPTSNNPNEPYQPGPDGAHPDKREPVSLEPAKPTHAQSQPFYDWLTNPSEGNLKDESEIILFKPRY